MEYNFGVALKTILQEGTLAWEYNPFRNYRLEKDMIYYRDQFHEVNEFFNTFVTNIDLWYKKTDDSDEYDIKLQETPGYSKVTGTYKTLESVQPDIKLQYSYQIPGETENRTCLIFPNNWYELGFSKLEEIPVVYQHGLLVDFITDEFEFDLNHPVQITPTYSYDNSVDLIINDGKSSPKIINSRFSAIGKNKYRIIDRNGNNDTNIYDQGAQFKIDSSLYKISSLIPEIDFGGEAFGGNLKVGNYHFYFKYSDLDGNESDFVAQSGLVSVFLGTDVNSINTGFRDQNSHKKIRFILSNLDEAYDYIIVYYSRATSEEDLNRIILCARIELKYKVSSQNDTIIDITGFENIKEVPTTELNERLLIYNSAKTQAVSLNMLFLGNVTKSNEDYNLLSRLALYIIPEKINKEKCAIHTLNKHYLGDLRETYYDPNFIYKYTGYWDDEIYRFGVVFIKSDNSLSPVFNVRGLHLGNKIESESLNDYNENDLITYDEVSYNIDKKFLVSKSYQELENAKGVCYIPKTGSLTDIIGIKFNFPKAVITKLLSSGIKGYFIVRQKRIPTTLCLAYTIGLESESRTPMIPTGTNAYVYEGFLDNEESTYLDFDDDGRKEYKSGNLLTSQFERHIKQAPQGYVLPRAAICPDYDVNLAYLNSLFTGLEFVVIPQTLGNFSDFKLSDPSRLVEVNTVNNPTSELKYMDVKILGVEDNVKLVGIDDVLFSARAGEAEEAYRYAHVGPEILKDHGGNNLIRGSFGPYLGITGYNSPGDLITIKIPGYNPANMLEYFKIRYHDASPFYPISDREIFVEDGDMLKECYRGDCYICKFTHRLNRNFTDPTTPTNDSIVDPACWTKNMIFEDEVLKQDNLNKINLGDVNAVNLGMWVSFILRSNINHSIRSLNESYVDETSSMGHCRGFYPYHPIAANSAYKLPEAGTYNKGFEASVGEQIFNELPFVPYYKDIFSTRIAYSNVQITSAFKNAYRVFLSTHYRDYPITYGEITKIIEWEGDLICVLEHGIYRIPINERAIAGEGPGGFTYINTSNVLPENPLVISDSFGSLWIDSIIKTPVGIYGVDTVAKKIWKVDNKGIELISDLRVLEFLNKNITLTERELTPIIGVRNVKTHYNAFKHDVMFTFYDDLSGIEEVAWNLCWNETMNKWVTFYSWLPSFSENIYNSYFSFDRETSKLIAKLVLNEEKGAHLNLIYLDSPVMHPSTEEGNIIGKLKYDLEYNGTEIDFTWELLDDPYLNNKYFEINLNGYLCYTNDYSDYTISIDDIKKITYNDVTYTLNDGNWVAQNSESPISADIIATLNKERKKLWKRLFEEDNRGSFEIAIPNSLLIKRKVYLLNVRVTPTITYNDTDASKAEFIANRNANAQLTGGYIDRTIAVIPKDHLDALSTDFWKHGQSGIIDIKEEIKPTLWYNKLHPFEFEFIVRDLPDTHKIFDNLIIISNKAEPESFHYEVVGESYEFAKDKKNMYIRQEATKELFYNNGYNIHYNKNYKKLKEAHRKLIRNPSLFDKSTIFPAYCRRYDRVDSIEDYYHSRPNELGKNFAYLSGSEITYYDTLDEFRIWTHINGINMDNEDAGFLKGNMLYKEDKWYVQIPPINFVQSNEPDWRQVICGKGDSSKVPIELKQANFMKADAILETPPLTERGLVFWDESKVKYAETKLRDKYIKIRIRYSGKDLAVIAAIKTLYSISYA